MALFDQKNGENDWDGIPDELRELILSLGSSDSKVRENAALKLKRSGKPAILALLKSLDSDNPLIRTGAAEILGTYGESALPTLLRLVTTGKERVRDGAAHAVGANGKIALKQLKEALSDDNYRVRRGAALSLGYFSNPGNEIKELLKDALDDKNDEVRTQAVRSLENIGWIPKKREYQALFYIVNGDYNSVAKLGPVALPVLEREIITGNTEKKIKITGILPRINDDKALFILINLLEDSDENVRLKVVEAIGESGDNRLHPYLVKKLTDPDLRVRKETAWALDRISWRPSDNNEKTRYLILKEKWTDLLQMEEAAIPVLIDSLKDKNPDISLGATEVLRAMGNTGYAAINEALRSDDQELKNAASKAAALIKRKNSEKGENKGHKLHKTPDELVEEQIKQQKNAISLKNSKSKEYWASLMRKNGLDEKRVLRFSKALSDENEIVRGAAVEALKNAGNAGIECTIDLLSDHKKSVRIAAIESLGDMEAKQAAPALVKLTRNKDFDIRFKSIRSLGMIRDPKTLPDLIKLFSDKDLEIRREATCSVGKFGIIALPLLEKAYLEPKKTVRISALRTVSRINHHGSISLSVRMLNDSEPDVRSCAIKTMKFLSINLFNPLIDESQRILIQGTFMEKAGMIATLSLINELRAKKAITAFEADENEEIRKIAVRALKGTLPESKFNQPVLKPRINQEKSIQGTFEDKNAIISDLKSSDEKVRMKAAEKVFLIGDEMIAPLIKSLNTGNPEYQNFIAEILTGLGNRAVNELIKILKTGTPGLKLIAAQNLGKIPDKVSIDALCQVLYQESNTVVRTVAAESLGFFGDSRSVDALIHTANDENKALRRAAIKSLGYARDKKAIPTIINAYSDEEPHMWQIATETLRKYDGEGIEALKSALITENHSFIRERVAQALDELNWIPENEENRTYYMIGKKQWSELERTGKPAIPVLEKIVSNTDDPTEKTFAMNLIRKLKG